MNQTNVYYTWSGINYNIPNQHCVATTIAQKMYAISKNEPYACTLDQLEQFCNQAFCGEDKNCFYVIFLYLEDGILSGFLNARIILNEVEIDFICVQKERRQEKVAQKLFSCFENKIAACLKTPQVFLEVGINNLPAISFYKKHGFKEISVRKKYYKSGEDALNMSKGY